VEATIQTWTQRGGRQRLVVERDRDDVREIEIAGDNELAAESLFLEHPRGHFAHHVAPLRVDVVQRELGDVDPVPLA
jgi:hypothetical protein